MLELLIVTYPSLKKENQSIKQILTFWADGVAVGLVDLLTSLRKLCLFYPLFSLFWKREVGGQGPPIPLAYHIISYHCDM